MSVHLSHVDHDLFRDFCGTVVPKVNATQVKTPRVQLSGVVHDGGTTRAKVLEYAIDGEIVARMVKACGETECWLRKDMAVATLVARTEAAAERERLIAEVKAYAHATKQHSRDQRAETYVLSTALVNAAIRHNSKIGRLWDQNSRGDRTRANLAGALDRAKRAEGAK